MIELQNNRLLVSFPKVHPKARCSIEFQRTLRIPDDNQNYPLPAGLGCFPILSVDDYHYVPDSWKQHGGVFVPMYQSEAMWIKFNSSGYPFAVKVAAGKIDAVSGKAWSNALTRTPQDYVVIPDQRWLDGFCVATGVVRQFVAMPLGQGVTAEEQITGEAEWGGLQLIFYPMKADEYRKRYERPAPKEAYDSGIRYSLSEYSSHNIHSNFSLGLAPGGRINQEIAEDTFGLDVWDTTVSARCFVHLVNSERYSQLTGQDPPTKPITAKQYADAKIPWFDYYLDNKTLPSSKILAGLDGLAASLMKKGKDVDDNKPILITKTTDLSHKKHTVRDGEF